MGAGWGGWAGGAGGRKGGEAHLEGATGNTNRVHGKRSPCYRILRDGMDVATGKVAQVLVNPREWIRCLRERVVQQILQKREHKETTRSKKLGRPY